MNSSAHSIRFLLNDEEVDTDAFPGLLVLDWLRRHRALTGTKEGCKEGDCGACVVLIGECADHGLCYRPIPSCLTPLGELDGKHLVTIEGLNLPGGDLTPLQRTVVREGATQCGYCTPGIIVSMTHCLLQHRAAADLPAMKDALSGHLCRCTGYGSLKRAAEPLRDLCPDAPTLEEALPELIAGHHLPAYFAEIPVRLRALSPRPAVSLEGHACRIAGGTDLYVQRGDEISSASVHLLGLSSAMKVISMEPGQLRVGAATPFEAFAQIPAIRRRIPRIDEYMHLIASLQIRNRATLGGNVVNASPIGDLTILLLALEARACLHGPGGERTLPLQDLFLGYKQLALEPDELITWFVIPLEADDALVHFEKVSKRTCLDIASVNSAIKLQVEDNTIQAAALSMGGVAPIPLLLATIGAWLTGKSIDTGLVLELQDRVDREIAPIDDIRGRATYKRLLARQLVAAHFLELFPERVEAEAFL